MFPDPFTYLKILLNVHQNPSRTPTMAINSLNILQNNIIVIKHPWQRNNFLDIQAQNFINKPRALLQAKFMELYIHPNNFFSSSFRIVNSYTRQLPAKKNRKKKKQKKKQIKIFKKQKKKPNTGYKDS